MEQYNSRKQTKACARFYLQHTQEILSREDFEAPYANARTKRAYDDDICYDSDDYEEEEYYLPEEIDLYCPPSPPKYPEIEVKEPGCD